MSGTFVLTDTLGSVFDKLFTDATRGVDADVRAKRELDSGQGGFAPRNPVPQSLVPVVEGAPGVRIAHGNVSGFASVVGTDGDTVQNGNSPTFGFSWLPRPFGEANVITRGHQPAAADEVVLDEKTASESGYRIGDEVPIIFLTGTPETFQFVGVFRFGDSDSTAGAHACRVHSAHRAAGRRPRRRVGLHLRGGEAGRLAADAGGQRAHGGRGHARRPEVRGAHRQGAGRRAGQQREGPARVPQHLLAGVRVHRAVRRLVHHLQHLLDHRRPTLTRAGAAARARCVGEAGHAIGRGGGVRRGAAVVGARARARRARRHRAAEPARGVRVRASERSAGHPRPDRHRGAGGRHRRHVRVGTLARAPRRARAARGRDA